jgi:hypothetical protein
MPVLVLILAHDDPQQGPMADEFMAAGACLLRDWRVARDLLNHKDSAETGCGQRLPTTQRTPIRRSQSVHRFRPAVIFVLGLIIEPAVRRVSARPTVTKAQAGRSHSSDPYARLNATCARRITRRSASLANNHSRPITVRRGRSFGLRAASFRRRSQKVSRAFVPANRTRTKNVPGSKAYEGWRQSG